jgi:hypothetical protein
MKSMKSRKAAASKNGKAKRGTVSKAVRFVGKHPKTAAGVLAAGAAGVAAFALLRGKKSRRKSAAGKSRRSAGAATHPNTN